MFFLIFLAILLVSSMCFLYKFEISENGYLKSELITKGYEKKITRNGDKYVDKLSIKKNTKYIDIFFNTDDVEYTNGKYYLEITNDNEIIYKDTLIYKIITRGKYRINLKKISDDYKISIKLTYSGKKTTFSPLINNGHILNQQFYKKTKTYSMVYIFIIVMNIIMIFLYKFIMSEKKYKIENKFLIISIPIFLAFIILIPMFLGHDERFHFYRIFEITEGGFLAEVNDGATGYKMPDAVFTKIGWKERHYSDIIDAAHEKIDRNNMTFISDVTMSVYSPIQYMPHVIGVSIAKIFSLRPIVIAYIGRLFNLLFCILLLYFTIKITPYGKNVFLLFSLIPIAIEGFTTLSGDGLTISTTYLFMAYVFSMLERKNKKLLKRDFIIIISLGIVLAFCKLVYIPIICLLLLIPKEYFTSIKKKIITIIPIIIIMVLFNLLWLKLANPYLQVYTQGQSNYQINFIFHHIITYFCMFMHSFLTQFLNLLKSAFGDSLLWGSAIQNYSIISFMIFLTTVIVCVNDESIKKKFNIYNSFIIGFIILVIIGLIFTSLFIQWTEYGSSTIEGVQGRYFSPFLPLLMILIGSFSSRKRNINESNLTKLVLLVTIFANYASLIEMFIKFI